RCRRPTTARACAPPSWPATPRDDRRRPTAAVPRELHVAAEVIPRFAPRTEGSRAAFAPRTSCWAREDARDSPRPDDGTVAMGWFGFARPHRGPPHTRRTSRRPGWPHPGQPRAGPRAVTRPGDPSRERLGVGVDRLDEL